MACVQGESTQFVCSFVFNLYLNGSEVNLRLKMSFQIESRPSGSSAITRLHIKQTLHNLILKMLDELNNPKILKTRINVQNIYRQMSFKPKALIFDDLRMRIVIQLSYAEHLS